MDLSRCQPPCSCLIASDDQHGKCVRCVGLVHARDVIFGISNYKYCKNFTLKTLCSRLSVFDHRANSLVQDSFRNRFLRVGGYFIYCSLRLWGHRSHIIWCFLTWQPGGVAFSGLSWTRGRFGTRHWEVEFRLAGWASRVPAFPQWFWFAPDEEKAVFFPWPESRDFQVLEAALLLPPH